VSAPRSCARAADGALRPARPAARLQPRQRRARHLAAPRAACASSDRRRTCSRPCAC